MRAPSSWRWSGRPGWRRNAESAPGPILAEEEGFGLQALSSQALALHLNDFQKDKAQKTYDTNSPRPFLTAILSLGLNLLVKWHDGRSSYFRGERFMQCSPLFGLRCQPTGLGFLHQTSFL
jgi:hypothetical protein